MSNLDAMNDMDSLLDGTLDDLADMPTFKPFCAGAHMLKLSFNAKDKINDIPTVKVKLVHISTEEKSDEDVAPTPGDETEVAYMLQKKDASTGKMVANELAQGQFKQLLAELKTGLNLPDGTSNRAVMEAAEGLEALCITQVRKGKADKDTGEVKFYTALKSVSVV